MSGAEPSSLAERWLHRGGPPRSGSVRQLWQWLADPARADAERLCFVGAGRPVSRGKGPQARPSPDQVTEWLPLITCLLQHEPRAVSRGRHAAVRHETPTAAAGGDPQEAAGGDPQEAAGGGPQEAGRGGRQSAPTLVLAVVRGLLLDLLATDDRERVQRAFETFAAVLEAINDAGPDG